MLVGVFIILLFLILGEIMSACIQSFIPASVCGMMLLFIALKLKWIKPDPLKHVVDFFMRYMAFFFIPMGVGVLVAFDQLKTYWIVILISVFISTVLTILVVGKIMHYFETKSKDHGTHHL